MLRTFRASAGNVGYYVPNRCNARGTVFHNGDPYRAYLRLLGEANHRVRMRWWATVCCLTTSTFSLGPGRPAT
jgi:hypothetical protein